MTAITDVPGIRVGHWTDERARTGCTVILADGGAAAGVSVRGGAPGTLGTDLLDPLKVDVPVDAVVLSGGSAFGLAAAAGVMRFLEERGIGFPIGGFTVPTVAAAIIFDLAVGDGRARPGPDAGYAACAAASSAPPAEGAIGAGTGATVGKLLGREGSRRGGVGTAARRIGDVTVGALFVVNALGDVLNEDGSVAGAPAGTPRIVDRLLAGVRPAIRSAGEGTTIGAVATNAPLTKTEANVIAGVAHDGIARAVHPAHGRLDGDTIFALSSRRGSRMDIEAIAAAAVEVTAEAIRRAVR